MFQGRKVAAFRRSAATPPCRGLPRASPATWFARFVTSSRVRFGTGKDVIASQFLGFPVAEWCWLPWRACVSVEEDRVVTMKSLHLRLLNQLEFLTKVIFDTAINNVTTFLPTPRMHDQGADLLSCNDPCYQQQLISSNAIC